MLAKRTALNQGQRVTVAELIRATGLPRNSVKAWLADDVFRYDSPAIAAWCAYFGCSVGDLLALE